MKGLHIISFLLLIIGGLNWLLVGITGWDIGSKFFGGQDAPISRVIYILVGIAALIAVATHKKDCRTCVEISKTTASQPAETQSNT